MQQIAETKRKENVVEYLLYMWQMEDLLRSVSLDVSALSERVLSAVPEGLEREKLKGWFTSLAHDMRANNAEISGHTADSFEIIGELAVLQHTLLTVIDDTAFKKIYTQAAPLLQEFRTHTDRLPRTEVETALTALYGALVLRLSGKKIGKETQKALDVFSAFLRHLAKAYRAMKAGNLPLNN